MGKSIKQLTSDANLTRQTFAAIRDDDPLNPKRQRTSLEGFARSLRFPSWNAMLDAWFADDLEAHLHPQGDIPAADVMARGLEMISADEDFRRRVFDQCRADDLAVLCGQFAARLASLVPRVPVQRVRIGKFNGGGEPDSSAGRTPRPEP